MQKALNVITTKAGILTFRGFLDPGLCRGDCFIEFCNQLFWKRFQKSGEGSPSAPPKPDWGAVPQSLLEAVVKEDDHLFQAEVPGLALVDWFEDATPTSLFRVILSAPHDGVHKTLRVLAEHRAWAVVEPPTPSQVLDGDASRLAFPDRLYIVCS